MFGKPDPLVEALKAENEWLRKQLEEKDKSLMALTSPQIYLARFGRAKQETPSKITVVDPAPSSSMATLEVRTTQRDPGGTYRPQHMREDIEKQFAS